MPSKQLRIGLLAVIALMVLNIVPARALEVWSGRSFQFEKADFADWTLEPNQDRITDQVWITRANTQGIFNIAQEEAYSSISPVDTEWATGDAVDHASLTFQTWVIWTGNSPPSTIGVDACVHLISEDIYIDIRFESFTSGGGGGGFAYFRAPRPPVAVESETLSRIKAIFD